MEVCGEETEVKESSSMEIQKAMPKTGKLLRENTGMIFGCLEINTKESARIVESGCLWEGVIYRIGGDYSFKVRFIKLFDHFKCTGIYI